MIRLNQETLAALCCEKRLDVVPGASHLFEEPGALDEVARLARQWFERHLVAAASSPQAARPPKVGPGGRRRWHRGAATVR